MTDKRIEPALTAAMWEARRRYQDHASFAVITLEGGNNDDLGATAERDAEYDFDAAAAHDNAKRFAAAIAALNAALPDSDPRKITRESIEDLYGAAGWAESEGQVDLADRARRVIAALESYLPAENVL